ncbi:hypothetical protein ACHHYP_04917 [Achlya hypogyna]|uniref:Mannitol dehydrogenase N-terminal domain-containing protein n=1 Tax=Achlya hypogyna TaxID=1202772 RepID=A0A1V9YZW7_ACHHY|nr:hypothetical protein ACHHYP_04917 [Achlya hypogyna]
MAFEIHGPAANVTAVCLGAGRFLRAVLVPALHHLGHGVIVAQPRGHDFADACAAAGGAYEMDVVEYDGRISTSTVEQPRSLGSPDGRAAFLALPFKLPNLRFIGVGVTEAGLQPGSAAMLDLAAFLTACTQALPDAHISVMNTDNVPANGDAIKAHVLACCVPDVSSYIADHVSFHNTMVDRITAARPSSSLVPFSEPLPSKALVVEDLNGRLEPAWTAVPGVAVVTSPGELTTYQLLKLHVANATHTAMVYYLALSRRSNTTAMDAPLERFLDELFARDIRPALTGPLGIREALVQQVYDEWLGRLRHPHFGMDTFFVAQNSFAKFQIRLWPLAVANLEANTEPSALFALATALLFRFLTPSPDSKALATDRGPIFTGFMDAVAPQAGRAWTYVGDLTADTETAAYTFRDGDGAVPTALHRAESASAAIMAVLGRVRDCDLTRPAVLHFVADVAALYNRLLSTPATVVLEDVLARFGATSATALKSPEAIAASVERHISSMSVIDMHTHLFPPTHEELMLWGIDALLTYHYLVAEYLATAPVSPETFYVAAPGWSVVVQADAVWRHLFCERSPLSEACQGVVTTLAELGLSHLVAARDLPAIRAWFAAQTPDEYVAAVYRIAKVRYVVMTNIPFDLSETQYWTSPTAFNRDQFKTALRIDQLLLGQWPVIGPALDRLHLPHTLQGVEQFLLHWIEIYAPEYFMASVPSTFVLGEEAMDAETAAAQHQPSGALLLTHVVLPLAERLHLPIALKFGAVRGLNPRLCLAGDGVAAIDVSLLTRLARANPRVKFLATFLSRVNQHEATVVASKFANVHLYGCWWYCNNPSIITELTRMRLELLGTGFTAQHSDARVLDQLIYKWKHFRTLLAATLTPLYCQLHDRGWVVTDADVQRDVGRLLGGSYEDFLAKSLA